METQYVAQKRAINGIRGVLHTALDTELTALRAERNGLRAQVDAQPPHGGIVAAIEHGVAV
jgi:hypothetical protein